ncbi:MAG: hypothetical protein CR217_02780 [Beijerinckiaceae bacterium]|nr:MAG: hypothetical protein CR217_02780 [Beijerinckiaceae bacterium]
MPRAEGFAVGFIGLLRALALGGAAVWSIVLACNGPCRHELFASMRGNSLCRSCCLDRRGERGCFFGLAVTGLHWGAF